MPEINNGVTIQQVTDAISAALAGLPTSFVNGGASMTVANLIANYPPASGNAGMYARVSDLYGSVDDIMRCRFDGTNYRWVPQRSDYAGTTAATGGTVNVVPLVTPPVLRTTGTLLGGLTLAMQSTNAWIGQRQTIVNNSPLSGLLTTITGLIGSNITIAGSGAQTVVYGPNGWFAAN